MAVTNLGAATALEEHGLIPDLVLDPAQLPDGLNGTKVLLPCAEDQPAPLVAALRFQTARVEAVPAYQLTLEDGLTSPTQLIEWLEAGQVDLVSFGSAQAVHDFRTSLPDYSLLKLLSNVPLVATGPAAQTLREYGLRNLTTHQSTTEALLEAILTGLSPDQLDQADEG